MKCPWIYSLFLFLAVIVAACSAENDNYGEVEAAVNDASIVNDVVVVRSLDESDSRTAIGAGDVVVWGESDELYGVNASARINALNEGVFRGIPTAHFTMTSGAGTKTATFMGQMWQKDSCKVNFLYPYSYTTTYASPIYNNKTYENYANPARIPITVDGQNGTLESMLAHDYLTATGEIMDKAVDARFTRRVAWMKVGFMDTTGVALNIALLGLNTIRFHASDKSFFIRTDTLDMTDPKGVKIYQRDSVSNLTFDFSVSELAKEVTDKGTIYYVYFGFIPSGVETQIDIFLSSKIASYAGSFKPITLEANNLYSGLMAMQLVEHAEGGYRKWYSGVVSTSVAAGGTGTKDDYRYDDLSMKMYGVTKDNYYDSTDTIGKNMAGTKYDYSSPWDSVRGGNFTGFKDEYGAIYAALDYMTGYKWYYSSSEKENGGCFGFTHDPYTSKNAEYTPFTWLLHDVYGSTEDPRSWFIKLFHQDYSNYEDARAWFIKLFHQDYSNYEDARAWFIKVLHQDYSSYEDARSWFIRLYHKYYEETAGSTSWFLWLLKEGYDSPWTITDPEKQNADKDGYDSPWTTNPNQKPNGEKDGYGSGDSGNGDFSGERDGYQYNR